ncbi:MAG TPA: hypothetical protein VMM27_11440 [Casimicrobiaceae bacterium]|nr:hypothetical protein [Casimicrobiaceae bacterium]
MKKCFAVAMSSLFLLSAPLRAQAIDYSDIWFLPAESGWGVNLIQNEDVIFATFFVYGANNQPTWFVAVMNRDGSGNFTGNLYTTVGSYYGGPWNPAANSETLAGTASFVPSDPYSGTLSYSLINGPTVVKPIQRQTLRTIVLGGNYVGGQAGAYSNCNNSGQNGPYTDTYTLDVTQANGAATFTFNYTSGATCTMAGSLQQAGQLYRIDPASYSCTGSLTFNASATMEEIKATAQGIEGRFTGYLSGGCQEDAQFSGALN